MRKIYGEAYTPHSDASIGDVLPPEYAIDYLAWQISGKQNEGNATEYFRLMEERDVVELTLAYAMKRTQMYLIEKAREKH